MASLPQGTVVVNGKFELLPEKVKDFVVKKVELCSPENVHICDGSEIERDHLTNVLVENGTAIKLEHPNLNNWYVF